MSNYDKVILINKALLYLWKTSLFKEYLKCSPNFYQEM